jgi:phosphatidylinositol alpha-1,6-mannosyltransferase
MRVALLTSSVDPAKGWGRYAAGLALGLARIGVSVELHLPKSYRGTIPSAASLEVRRSLPAAFVTFGWRPWRCVSLYSGSLGVRVGGELVHSLVEVPYVSVARVAARRMGLPYLVTMHGSYAVKWATHPVDRLLFGHALRGAAAIAAVSGRTAERARSLLPMVPIEVIGNGIDCGGFSSDAAVRTMARMRFGLGDGEKLVLSVGALKGRKGFDTLLRAFAAVKRAAPATRLVIVGSGNSGPYLELARELDIQESVHLLQRIPEEDLRALYNAADIFALLPREMPAGEMEGFGLVYLEAGACGKPVIGTRSGGVPDAVVDGHTGLLAPPDNPEEAAECILRLLRDEELARRLGENGRHYANSHSWECVARQYLELYQKLVRRGAASAPYG